jgi:iron complex outermembrane receptor protein
LFGKNAASGAINITTEDPTAAQHEWLDASYYGGGNEYRIVGGVSGGIVDDKLTAVIAALTGHYDGNVQNLYLNKTVNGYERNGIRSKFRYTADNLTVTLAMDYLRSLDTTPKLGVFTTDTNIAFPSGIVSAPNATLLKYLNAAGITPSTSNTKLLNDVEGRVADNNGGLSLTADWQLGQYDLTSITAYRRWSNRQYQDTDGLAPIVYGVNQSADRGDVALDQISEELRIASPKGHLVDYVAGLYYMRVGDTEDYSRDLFLLASGAPTNGYGIANFNDVSNNAAAFAEANINVTDSFRAILGVRAIHDNLSENFNRYSNSAVALPGIRPSFASNGSTSDYGYSDRIGLQYDVAKNIETYFTYSRGYLGPAYNLYFNQFNPVETAPLPPETSNAYELGVKTTLLDNRLKANFALFQQNFQNYQTNLNQFVAGASISDLIDAGSVYTKGFESDITAKPIKNMTVNFATAYTLARIDKFSFVGPVPPADYDGKPLPNAPNWKINGRVTYIVPVTSAYDIDLNTQYSWQSATQFQLQETADTIQPAYGIWDAGIDLLNGEQSWKIGVMVKNILNQHYASTLFEADGGVARGVPRDDSRYFGVDLRKDF